MISQGNMSGAQESIASIARQNGTITDPAQLSTMMEKAVRPEGEPVIEKMKFPDLFRPYKVTRRTLNLFVQVLISHYFPPENNILLDPAGVGHWPYIN